MPEFTSQEWASLSGKYAPLTDKFEHGYMALYREIFETLDHFARICEIGVWRGHSLALWHEIFPHGLVIGVDDGSQCFGHGFVPKAPEGTFLVQLEQDDEDLPDALHEHCPSFDVIIDDASHRGELSEKTFSLLWPMVKSGGWYVVEDWVTGIEGSPFYGHYNGDSMLKFVQGLIEFAGRGEWNGTHVVEEFRGRPGIIALRKR